MQAIPIRRLGVGDEALLRTLALEDADFDLDGRGDSLLPLDTVAARRFLAHPTVLVWAAIDGETIVGFLYCVEVPLRSGSGHEVLLYEIGVRQAYRQRGIGRALIGAMDRWMREQGIVEVWVLADNSIAVAFYEACGFAVNDEQPVYLTRTIAGGTA